MDEEQKLTFDEVIANDKHKEEKQQILDEFLSNDMYKLNKICRFLVSKKGAPLMHEDDLYSLGRWVFLESVLSYDPSKVCKFSTYLEGNIWRAFYDWTRDNTRWKRCNLQTDKDGNLMRDENNNPIIIPDVSIDAPAEDGVDLSERVASNFSLEEELSEEFGFSQGDRIQKYLVKLSKMQRKIVLLLSEGYKALEIQELLHISSKKYLDNIKAIQSYENIRVLM